MKKNYLTGAALIACTLMNAQAFWTATSYKGAFPVTDNTTATDWTNGWTNWDPENVNYATPTSTLTGDITSNTSISGVVYLNGFVHVKNNAILTIAPGTVIRGKKDVTEPGVLIITRGSKIMAQGTASQPIVFTSNETVSNGRNPGDWGGVIILGNGIINTGGISQNPNVSKVEGFLTASADRYYGGTNNSDNSGILSYIRIEFAGISLDPATPNSEINGLTMGGVGSGTQIDHIQVSFCGDDSFEWFGGTVDAKYLISNRGVDDDFDTDFGYSGRVQFGLAVRDQDFSDVALANGASNGFESDNSDPINLRFPLTKAIFSNMTIIGPKRNGTGTLPVGEKFECGIHIRRNSAQSIFNSLFIGWEKGLRLQNAVTFDNYNTPATTADSLGVLANNIMTSNIPLHYISEGSAGSTTVTSLGWYQTYGTTNAIDTITTAAQIDFVNGFPSGLEMTPDFRLNSSLAAANGASFSNSKFSGGFVGINELKNSFLNTISVYPNPATDHITLTFDIKEKNTLTITLYDVLGNALNVISQNESFEQGNHLLSIHTSNLSNGIYYIAVDMNGMKETKKIVINH